MILIRKINFRTKNLYLKPISYQKIIKLFSNQTKYANKYRNSRKKIIQNTHFWWRQQKRSINQKKHITEPNSYVKKFSSSLGNESSTREFYGRFPTGQATNRLAHFFCWFHCTKFEGLNFEFFVSWGNVRKFFLWNLIFVSWGNVWENFKEFYLIEFRD
jgi:hypothetical protein